MLTIFSQLIELFVIENVSERLERMKRLDVYSSRNSISKMANDSILQYPVLVTDSISLEDLTMVTKALEREFVTFFRIATGLDDHSESDKRSYLKKFHQNIGAGKSATKYNSSNLTDPGALITEEQNFDMRNLNDLSTSFISENSRPAGNESKSNYGKQLVSSDIDKANELVPTLVTVNIFDEVAKKHTELLVGLKAVSHVLESNDILENLKRGIDGKSFVSNFLKVTIGEKRFVKDYVLNQDEIKEEVLAKKQNSKWWRTLRKRAIKESLNRFTGGHKQLLPNSSIVISTDEVERFNNMYNINLLRDMKAVKNLMDQFFLLGFVILDPAAEIAHLYFDGNDSFSTVSYSALERENKKGGSDMKSLMKILSRM